MKCCAPVETTLERAAQFRPELASFAGDFRLRASEWWTTRLIAAAPTTWSRIRVPLSLTGRFLAEDGRGVLVATRKASKTNSARLEPLAANRTRVCLLAGRQDGSRGEEACWPTAAGASATAMEVRQAASIRFYPVIDA